SAPPGTVELLLVPLLPRDHPRTVDALQPSPELIATVRDYLDDRRLLATQLVVDGAAYLGVRIEASVVVEPTTEPETARQRGPPPAVRAHGERCREQPVLATAPIADSGVDAPGGTGTGSLAALASAGFPTVAGSNLPARSSYLRYLPGIYHVNDFLGRFLLI